MDIDTYCEKLAPFISIIKNGIIPLINIGIPFILIVLGSIDLGKAVVSGDDKSTKEAQTNLVKRIIYGVAIFFVPLILSLVFKLVGDSIKIENDEVITPTSWLKCWSGEEYTPNNDSTSEEDGGEIWEDPDQESEEDNGEIWEDPDQQSEEDDGEIWEDPDLEEIGE